MHLVGQYIVKCRPLLGALPLYLEAVPRAPLGARRPDAVQAHLQRERRRSGVGLATALSSLILSYSL